MSHAQQLALDGTGYVATGGEHEFHPTLPWVTRALVDSGEIRLGGTWLEPCAGGGAIIRAVPEVRWLACEIRPECFEPLSELCDTGKLLDFWFGDFLADPLRAGMGIDWVVTNPPLPLFRAHGMPDVLVLEKRPSFSGDGKTDGCEYAWMLWRTGQRRSHGNVRVLEVGP